MQAKHSTKKRKKERKTNNQEKANKNNTKQENNSKIHVKSRTDAAEVIHPQSEELIRSITEG